jgi:hypothetical protein
MTRSEWLEQTRHEATDAEWEVIHTVYQFHPAVPEVGGKARLAQLFQLGGMGLLTEMLPKAETFAAMEEAVHQAREASREANRKLQETLATLHAARQPYRREEEETK